MSEEIQPTEPQEIKIPPTVTYKRSMRDNPLLKWFLSVVLYPALFLGALIVSSTMTFDVIGMILPGNLFMQYLAVMFYDFGALVWFLVYVVKARGMRQRGASLFIFMVDLAGAAFMIYSELNLGGQTLVQPPEWLGRWLINGTTAVMFLNLAAAYYYHMTSPEDLQAAAEQDQDDELQEVAMSQQRAYMEANIHNLAAPLFARSVARWKMRNALPLTDADYRALEGDYVDGQVIPSLPAGQRVTFWGTLRHFFAGAPWRRLLDIRSSRTSQPSENPTPEPDQPPTA